MRLNLRVIGVAAVVRDNILPGTSARVHISEDLEEAILDLADRRFTVTVEHGDDALAEAHSDRLMGLTGRVAAFRRADDMCGDNPANMRLHFLITVELDEKSAMLVRSVRGRAERKS